VTLSHSLILAKNFGSKRNHSASQGFLLLKAQLRTVCGAFPSGKECIQLLETLCKFCNRSSRTSNEKNISNIAGNLEELASLDFLDLCLLGETGTGKTHTANLIHDLSPRLGHPMVSINCAELSPYLIESEPVRA